MSATLAILISALYGMTATILGAFGAHALRGKIAESALASYHTGVQYQFIHALTLMGTALLMQRMPSPALRLAATLFAVGVLLFSGSIYLLATRELTMGDRLRLLGPVTPLGGICLIAGWAMLALGSLRAFGNQNP